MSTRALPVHIALVDETKRLVNGGRLQAIAGSLNEQIQSDFAPVWKVAATVGAYSKAPPGCWSVVIKSQLDEPGALGYHTDENGQPISYVMYTTPTDTPVTISHEVLEMLADPFGNRMHSARLPDAVDLDFKEFGLKTKSHHVGYLLEVCDPCERTSYEVGGIPMSDFLLPAYYRSSPISTGAYSHAGGVARPREVPDGGYVSFSNLETREWYQIFNEGGRVSIQDIGQFRKAEHGSLREFTDRAANARRKAKKR